MEIDVFDNNPDIFRKVTGVVLTDEDFINVWSKDHGNKLNYLYQRRFDMIKRCHNQKSISYHNYGLKNKTVCDEWRNNKDGVYNFINWVVSNYDIDDIIYYGLEIDRINNNEGYCPENCRFVTKTQQQLNRELKDELRRTFYPNLSQDKSVYTFRVRSRKHKINIMKSSLCVRTLLEERNKCIKEFNLDRLGVLYVSNKLIQSIPYISYEEWNNIRHLKKSKSKYKNIYLDNSNNTESYVCSIVAKDRTFRKKSNNILKAMEFYNQILDENPSLQENKKYMKIPNSYITLEKILTTIIDNNKGFIMSKDEINPRNVIDVGGCKYLF